MCSPELGYSAADAAGRQWPWIVRPSMQSAHQCSARNLHAHQRSTAVNAVLADHTPMDAVHALHERHTQDAAIMGAGFSVPGRPGMHAASSVAGCPCMHAAQHRGTASTGGSSPGTHELFLCGSLCATCPGALRHAPPQQVAGAVQPPADEPGHAVPWSGPEYAVSWSGHEYALSWSRPAPAAAHAAPTSRPRRNGAAALEI